MKGRPQKVRRKKRSLWRKAIAALVVIVAIGSVYFGYRSEGRKSGPMPAKEKLSVSLPIQPKKKLSREKVSRKKPSVEKPSVKKPSPGKVVAKKPAGKREVSPPIPAPEARPKFTGASITSTPPGAQVYIGAELKGTTPIKKLKLDPGSYSLVIEKQGYASIVETLVVEKGREVKINRNLSVITGSIEVTARPAGVQIYLDGWDRGTSPQTIPGVVVGTHEIVLKYKDYYEKKIKVEVKEKQTAKIEATLQGLPGRISVTSRPPGAEVYTNGRDSGKETTATLDNISPGQVEIKVEKRGYRPEIRKDILKPKSSLTFNFLLTQTLPQGLEAIGTATDPVSGLPMEVRSEKDGAEMDLIPAGEFLMGSNNGYSDEQPVHKVYVDAFYMDKYEVTVGQYRKFVEETGYREPDSWSVQLQYPRRPVVDVSWNDAVAYTKWAGKRLPTEAEWEKAARGGLEGKKYPWGDSIDNSKVNYNSQGTTPVGSYPPNGYGLYDMAGNVWEWVADWYDSGYYKNSPYKNPAGPNSGTSRVLRGGSWYDGAGYLRVADRFWGSPGSRLDYGFRCARTP